MSAPAGRMATALTELARRHRVPGAQLAVSDGDHMISTQAGELTAGGGVPVTEQAAFPIGSVTKPCTAILAMILVADGDASLDDPVARYLPALDGGPGGTLTLRQLLSHTSGLASAAADEAGPRHRWVAANCRPADVVHQPGTAFSYSNVGYILAGHIAELITAMDWQEALRTLVLRPPEIEPVFLTGFDAGQPSRRAVAAGHTVHPGNGQARPVRQVIPDVEAPAGGLAMSAADLVTLARSRPLGYDLTADMCRDQLTGLDIGSFGLADSWALGWAIYRQADLTWYGHDGSGDGTSCHLRFEPESGTVVALTANASSGPALWRDLVTELARDGLEVPTYRPDLAGSPVPAPGWCAGRYRNGRTEIYVRPGQRDGFELVMDGIPAASLTCYDGLKFGVGGPDGNPLGYVGRFVPGQDGGADLIQIGGRLGRRASEATAATSGPSGGAT